MIFPPRLARYEIAVTGAEGGGGGAGAVPPSVVNSITEMIFLPPPPPALRPVPSIDYFTPSRSDGATEGRQGGSGWRGGRSPLHDARMKGGGQKTGSVLSY